MSEIYKSKPYESSSSRLQRVNYIDMARAILIILVVVGHSVSPITPYIYLFHMAAFVFLSGFLYKNEELNVFTQIVKKIKSIYIPYIKYQIIFLMLHNLFIDIGIYSGLEKYTLNDYVISMINIFTLGGGGGELLGAFWFLVALFNVTIIYTIVNWFSSKFNNREKIKTLIIISIYLIGNILIYINIRLPRHIDTAMILIIIFYIGNIYKNNENKITFKRKYLIMAVILLIILKQFGSIDVGQHNLNNPIYFVLASITGIYIIIYISKLLLTLYKCNLFLYIGRNTIIILALHMLSFKLVNGFIVNIINFPGGHISDFPIINIGGLYWILYSVIGIFVPLSVNWIMIKTKTYMVKMYRLWTRG